MKYVTFFVSLFLISPFALAQTYPTTDSAQAKFLQKLHAINEAEIRVGKLAEKKGQTPLVKEYGSTLVHDHTDLDKQANAVAKQSVIELSLKRPAPTVAKLKANLDDMYHMLESTPNAQFDGRLAADMVKGHQEAIDMVKKAQKEFEDNPRFEKLAQTALPVLEKHLALAQNILLPGRRVLGE